MARGPYGPYKTIVSVGPFFCLRLFPNRPIRQSHPPHNAPSPTACVSSPVHRRLPPFPASFLHPLPHWPTCAPADRCRVLPASRRCLACAVHLSHHCLAIVRDLFPCRAQPALSPISVATPSGRRASTSTVGTSGHRAAQARRKRRRVVCGLRLRHVVPPKHGTKGRHASSCQAASCLCRVVLGRTDGHLCSASTTAQR